MFISERIISILAPHSCINCGKEGFLLCDWCKNDAYDSPPPRCYVCYKFSSDAATCRACRKRARPSHAWIVTNYDGIAKELVKRFKFDRMRTAHVLIAESLVAILPDLSAETIVAHIPTATSRRRQRGYDQSELLARELATHKKLMHHTLLARKGQSRQVGADKSTRSKQMGGAFYVVDEKICKGATVLLVDDLVTTGATLEAATKTLKDAGAKKVYAAVFAQKQ